MELWRGDRLRDRFQKPLEDATGGCWSYAFRLTWCASSPGSSRLIARVLLDGAEVARSAILLGRPDVDAQGRFADIATRPASAATLLSFEREFQKLLQEDRTEVAGGE